MKIYDSYKNGINFILYFSPSSIHFTFKIQIEKEYILILM